MKQFSSKLKSSSAFSRTRLSNGFYRTPKAVISLRASDAESNSKELERMQNEIEEQKQFQERKDFLERCARRQPTCLTPRVRKGVQ